MFPRPINPTGVFEAIGRVDTEPGNKKECEGIKKKKNLCEEKNVFMVDLSNTNEFQTQDLDCGKWQWKAAVQNAINIFLQGMLKLE